VLHEVGFTPRQLRPEEFREVLQYGLGLTDIAKHTFGMDSQLPAGSLGPEATRALRERIDFYQPRVLAFTSVTGGSRYLGRKARLGLQPERVGKTIVWVLPSPAQTANWRWDAGSWRQLAGFVVTG